MYFTGKYVVKFVKETCETVHKIAKNACQKVTWFDEPSKTACFWGVKETSKEGNVSDLGLCNCEVYFHVFHYLPRKGPAVPLRDLQKMDPPFSLSPSLSLPFMGREDRGFFDFF